MIKPPETEDYTDATTLTTVKWLAYGGLCPFIFLAISAWLDLKHSSQFRHALVAYGAVILSFVGALHWGVALSRKEMSCQARRHGFVWSVIPALIAWIALLLEAEIASLLIVAGLVLHFLRDLQLVKLLQLPSWYLPLRLRLTVFSSLSLLSIYLYR